MLANKARIAYKQAFFILCLVSFLQIFPQSYCKAQLPTEIPDQPIDPNMIKNLPKSALENYLRDKNQNQSKPGEDIHRKNQLLRNETRVYKDSSLKEENKSKERTSTPEDVYGNNLFQNSAIL